MSFTKLDYCQYLLSSQINYTITNLAEHLENQSHDTINLYLATEKLTPNLLWDNVKDKIEFSAKGYVIFDDTVLDKRYSKKIDITRRQYSGNEHRVIKGIGLVSCVYVNPEKAEFWVIDYRVYDPDTDHKTKLDHVEDMLLGAVNQRKILFRTVLMDTWYASSILMNVIDKLGKIYYCPLRKNRLVDDSNALNPYKPIGELEWDEEELITGKLIKIKKFVKDKKVKLFRVVVCADKTEYIVTNDKTQNDANLVQKECKVRWKIERSLSLAEVQFHREIKQLTGIEACQCRKGRIQRNHIACSLLVWSRLKQIAYKTGETVYQIKAQLLSGYLFHELRFPSRKMSLA
jgi:hypothetical protein